MPKHRCHVKTHPVTEISQSTYESYKQRIAQTPFLDALCQGKRRVMNEAYQVEVKQYQSAFTLAMKRNVFGLYTITVYVEHIPCTFIIDTGAQITGIKARKAKELSMRKAKGTLEVGSIGGKQKTLQGLCAESFQFGAIEYRNMPMIALGEQEFSMRFGKFDLLAFDGILGWDILSQTDFEMDDIAHEFRVLKNRFRFPAPNMVMGGFPVFLAQREDGGTAIFGFDSGSRVSWIGDNAIRQQQYEVSGEFRSLGFGVHGVEAMDVKLVKEAVFYLDRAQITLTHTMSGRTDMFPHVAFDGVFGNEIFRGRRIRLVNSLAMVLLT